MSAAIVCGLDRSAASTRAAEFGALLAERLGAELVTVHVQPPPRLFPGLGRPRPPAVRPGFLSTGDPTDELVRFANELDAELVVVGSRGRRGLGRALLGSVSSSLMVSCPCPVVVVPPGAEVPRESERLSSVVCGVEGFERDVPVLQLASDLVERLGGTLHAVHSFQPRPVIAPAAPPRLPALEPRAAAERVLEHSLAAARVSARAHVATQPAAQALELCARREAAGLIVVGCRGRGKLGSVLLGSVSTQVSAEAERPLVVLPSEARVGSGSGHYEVVARSAPGA